VCVTSVTKIISLQLAISFIVGCSLSFPQLSSLPSSTLGRVQCH